PNDNKSSTHVLRPQGHSNMKVKITKAGDCSLPPSNSYAVTWPSGRSHRAYLLYLLLPPLVPVLSAFVSGPRASVHPSGRLKLVFRATKSVALTMSLLSKSAEAS